MQANVLCAIESAIMTVINTEGFLAGGCVRDTLYGVEPKDYDFVILDRGWNHADVFEYMSSLSNRLSCLSIKSEVYQAYEQANSSSFSNMFYGCMKVHFDFGEVDILFSVFKDIDVHVANHDCNMNECYLGEDGIIVGERVSELKFIPGVSEERQLYMRHKFDRLSNGAACL